MVENNNANLLPDTQELIDDGYAAMKRLAKQLKETDFEDLSNIQKGQLFAYVAKAMDGMVRLDFFRRGEADSRTEVVGLDSLFQYLTDEQFTQVQAWIAEGQALEKAREIPADMLALSA
jgi:hypothetical protein